MSPPEKQTRSMIAACSEKLELLFPVAERELRVALHRRDLRKARFKVAGLGVLATSFFLICAALSGKRTLGGVMQFCMFLAGMGFAVGPAFRISIGLFAEERRQRTLELMRLAGVGSGELFVGKVLGGALVSSCELLALVPLMALPFLLGGLSFNLFLASVICLPTIFALVVATGSLASALSREEGSALVLLGVLLGVLCLALPLPYNLGLWLTGTAPFSKSWLLLSPVLGPWMATKDFWGFRMGDFWLWTAATWLWAITGLLLAATVLNRNWRRELDPGSAETWRAKWTALLRGSASSREALRRRLLVSPYQWLVQHDRRPVVQAWAFISSVCVLWLLGWCAWPRLWPSTINFFTTSLVLLVGTDSLVSYAAARRMAADRRDGALELLLTTALSPEQILAGQKAALTELFRPVKLGLSALLIVMFIAGLLTRSWKTQALVSYLAVWCLLFFWCWRPVQWLASLPMWVAANCGRTIPTFRTNGWNRMYLVYWVWMIANSSLLRGARSFPSGSALEMWVTLASVVWLLLFTVARRKSAKDLEGQLVAQLRLLALEPVPKFDDPRFKQWTDIWTRFPEPPGGRSGYPGEDLTPPKPVAAAGAWFWRFVGRLCGLAWGKLRHHTHLRRG